MSIFHLKNLPGTLRKLFPTIVLLIVGALAGATDVFSAHVHELVSKTLQSRLTTIVPTAINLLIIVIAFNLAYLLFGPLSLAAEKLLKDTKVNSRANTLVLRTAKLGYWLLIAFAVLSMFAPEIMAKLVLGISVFTAALALALQGVATTFISGWQLQASERIKIGDDIKIVGLDVQGVVVDVGSLSTLIETKDGVISVSNKDMWEKPLIRKKPAQVLIVS